MQSRKGTVIGIAGGSGAGKSWLAEKIARRIGRHACRISLDDFYLDRSHLSPAQRERINFDHPRAVDWKAFEQALRLLRSGREAAIPCYDFSTHSRRRKTRRARPREVIIVDGLWLFKKTRIRRLFDLTIFVDCPEYIRLRRRLERDTASRGRTAASIRRQFRETVEPMHRAHVLPQARNANVVIDDSRGRKEITRVMRRVLSLVADRSPRLG